MGRIVLNWPVENSRRSKTNNKSNRPLKIPKTRAIATKFIAYAAVDPEPEPKQIEVDKKKGVQSVAGSECINPKLDLSIPVTIYDFKESVMKDFSFSISYFYSTNVASTCDSIMGEIFMKTYFCEERLSKIYALNEVVIENKPETLLLQYTSVKTKNEDLSSFWVDKFLEYYRLLMIYKKHDMRGYFASIGLELEMMPLLFDDVSKRWTQLFCFYDSLSAMMAGRSPCIPKRFITVMDEKVELHDSDLMATVGCPLELGSLLVRVAHILGDFNGFEGITVEFSNRDSPLWSMLHEILFEIHAFKIGNSDQQDENSAVQKVLADCWRSGLLLFIYSVFYRETAHKSHKMKVLRDNIFQGIKTIPLNKSKQLFWALFLACCELPADNMMRQAFSLELLRTYYRKFKGSAVFLMGADMLLQIWLLLKEDRDKFWWEALAEICSKESGEPIYV